MGTEPNRSARSPMPGLMKFARDVAVNVLANLVAAAVIYLAGAATGVLPRSPKLILGSLSTVLLIGFLGIFVISRFMSERKRLYASAIGLALAGTAIALGALAGALDHEPYPRWAFVVFGIWTAVAGTLVFYNSKKSKL
jgi:hypothetical protein